MSTDSQSIKPITYNVFAIVVGTILLLIGIYFVYSGYNHYSYYDTVAGQLSAYINHVDVDNAKQFYIWEICGGIVSALIGLGLLGLYKNG